MDRQIVRTEAPQCVLVGAQAAEVHARAVQVVQGAERARGEHVAQSLDRGVVKHEVADHADLGRGRGRRGDGERVGRVHRERFLDENVLSSRERRACETSMRGCRRCDDDGVDVGVREEAIGIARRARRRSERVSACERRLVGIRDSDELASRFGRDRADVIDAPRTGSDDAEANHR